MITQQPLPHVPIEVINVIQEAADMLSALSAHPHNILPKNWRGGLLSDLSELAVTLQPMERKP